MGKLKLNSGTYYEVLLDALSSAIREKERQIQESYTEEVKALDKNGEILSQHHSCSLFLKTMNTNQLLISDFKSLYGYFLEKYFSDEKRKN
ncbi:hypothetical protein [Dickeya fangzhongdai]|uniref:hypothetical protein n=1 Tax=Dickeya fangzhongdai TaxID=1778540 RepID=UPI0011AB4508|nr:hypothetical protein [Dickeya fangzhongdai]GGB97392.1 hypothetical protein GCM10007171_13090 [Dickeya fangzhongdai]